MDRPITEGPVRARDAWLARLRVVHPFPSLLVAALTVALVPVADRHARSSTIAVLGVSMLCYQFTIGLANDLVDAAADAQAKPWKAIPSGAVARRLALFVAFGLTVCGLALSATLGPVVWSIGVAGLACGLTYDLWLKRTTWSWLPYAVAFPLLPTWVFVATNSWSDRLWWIFPLGAVLGFALHLANQAPDIENDRSIGAGGFAEKLGQERAAHLARALFAACGLLATLIVGWGSARGLLMTGTVVLALVSAALVRRRRVPDGLFAVLAVGSAAIAVLFLSSV